jgi:hypothetical protein
MTIGTFNILSTKPKVVKTRDGTDVAARYFAYKLYEATDGQPMQWRTILGLSAKQAAVDYAVEKGWIIVEEGCSVRVTDEGCSLVRRGML